MRTLVTTHPQQLIWLYLSPSPVSVSLVANQENGGSSGSRPLLFQCDLSLTWGYTAMLLHRAIHVVSCLAHHSSPGGAQV